MVFHRVKFETVVLFLLWCCFTATCGVETVKYAAVIYRHGQRTPVKPYPTDPWRNESLWPVRFGELTNTGKLQHYALGQWLRERYANLISARFDPDEVYIKSTDYDRTLMSAQANLAGLYPPIGKAVWNNDLAWQPIPVHSESLKEDSTLAMAKKCNAYDDELAKFVKTQEFKQRLSKYQKLMDYLTAYTGEKVKNFEDIEYIYSNLYIETLFNFTLPNWTHAVYPVEMAEPAANSFTINTGNTLLARLCAGPLLQLILSHMNKVRESNGEPVLKFSMFSAHDDTVANILNALKLFDNVCPVFTATVFFELIHDDSDNEYYVKVSYRNSTEIVEPHLLNIPHCGGKCPLIRFQKLYQNLLEVNWEVECGNKEIHYPSMCYILALLLLIFVVGSLKDMSFASRVYGYTFKSKPSELTVLSASKSSSELEILTCNEKQRL